MTPYRTHMNRSWMEFRSYRLKVFDLMKLVIQSGALLVRYSSSSSALIRVWVENKVIDKQFYVHAFGRCFYPKWLTLHWRFTFYNFKHFLFYALCKFLYLSKATCIAFNVHILSVYAFPGNRTHVVGVASTMLYCLSYYLQSCIWKKLLSIGSYIALKVYILLVHAFPGNRTHDLGVAITTPCSTLWATFTFMHLTDTFMQSDLQYIKGLHFINSCIPWENWAHNFGIASTMLYCLSYIYSYAFGGSFYLKWLTLQWRFTFHWFMHSLGIEPMVLLSIVETQKLTTGDSRNI